ncbi:MAG TPA: putative baseplate assembly protein [Verrucomicrobiae bacterium]|jgi:hypothetical protein
MKPEPTLICHGEKRRLTMRERRHTNGIDYIEVVCVEVEKQPHRAELRVHLFRTAPESLEQIGAFIEGGRRVRDIRVTNLEVDDDDSRCLRVAVDKVGDFSNYTLRLVVMKDRKPTAAPPEGFDPRYAKAEFNFKAGCPSDLDCKIEPACPPEKRAEPEVNYLAKDYASFRQLILGRLALILPDWRERHVPDLGVALVEVLAYAGDQLSYYQDAVATEAYLDTARQRISVRRHARLVDYFLHEGCNARAWVCVELTGNEHQKFSAEELWFAAGLESNHAAERGQMTREEFLKLAEKQSVVFQPLRPAPDIELFKAHNELKFYTWGDSLCCLPRGATSATLKYDWKKSETTNKNPKHANSHAQEQCEEPARSSTDARPKPKPSLKAGDVLIFEEVKGPKTGVKADADPTRRWAVKLTSVEPGVDPLTETQIVEIEWAAADALPFPLCISARLPAPDCRVIDDISVARGNVILVDHGRPVKCEPLGQVPCEHKPGDCGCEGSPVEMTDVPGKFSAELRRVPLTFSQCVSKHPLAPASKLLDQDPREALPWISVTAHPGVCPKPGSPAEQPKLHEREKLESPEAGWQWQSRRDLLGSCAIDQDFVVEVDNEGRAHLRFGDGECGRQPPAGADIHGNYRFGNGPAGNVGAETITAIVLENLLDGATLRARNPLPARGGVAPEPLAEAKLFAPGAFRKVLQRAIIAGDYARLVERDFADEVQRAGAALRWTGSWFEAQVAVDARGAEEASDKLLDRIVRRLHRYRRMGHDVKAVSARLVPLDLELVICVKTHYLRGHVEAALREIFSDHALPDGRLGFFHPDNLSFGEGVFVSKLVAIAQAVTGVESVNVKTLQRVDEGDQGELDVGILTLGPLEVAQLDNDPSLPEHGKLTLTMRGGR